MKTRNIVVTSIAAISLLSANFADAGSIGRPGGSSFSSRSSSSFSSSSSKSSYSAPSSSSSSYSKPAAPTTGGIGGTTSSYGVRKSEVTNSVKQEAAPARPASSGSSYSSSSYSSPSSQQNYNSSAGGYGGGGVTNGSTFMSSLGGSFLGSWIGSSIGSSHASSPTVINNNGGGGSGGGGVAPSGSYPQGMNPAGGYDNNQMGAPYKKPYTIWSFMGDVLGFTLLLALIGGIIWLLYKAYVMIKNYIKKERGMSDHPFNPTQRFWEIQRAFSEADADKLRTLLGPDLVDELTANLEPQTLNLSGVSHEVRLHNSNEFSIWYKFEDTNIQINQVWHYERFGKEWKLNGIENI